MDCRGISTISNDGVGNNETDNRGIEFATCAAEPGSASERHLPAGDIARPDGKKGRTHHPTSPWTDEKIALLVRLHGEKVSAKECAALLGVTRNAVIGRWHRMGLKSDKPVGGRTVIKVARAKRSATVLEFKPRSASVTPLHIQLDDLKPHHCRFPHGDGPFTFCGHAKQDKSSYCPDHFALTWMPSRARA